MIIKTANTILYCKHWEESLVFYRDRLGFPITLSRPWFVEFMLNDSARLSIADEKRTHVSSAGGQGLTLSFEVHDIEEHHRQILRAGLSPGPIRDHPWDARVFYLNDPEGNRLEFWMACAEKQP